MVCEDKMIHIQKEVELDIVNLNDIENIYEIEKVSFKKPWQKKYFNLLVNKKDIMFVKLIYKRQLIGYFILLYENEQKIKIAHLLNIAIHPDFRGKGFGKFLLYAVKKLSLAEKCSIIKLEVRISNKKAINLYKNCGFEISRILSNYYGDEDGLLMEKYLF